MYTASWDDVDAVIKCQLGDVLHYELGEELEPRKEPVLFDKPTRGTSVEKFKEMVYGHVKVRILTQPCDVSESHIDDRVVGQVEMIKHGDGCIMLTGVHLSLDLHGCVWCVGEGWRAGRSHHAGVAGPDVCGC